MKARFLKKFTEFLQYLLGRCLSNYNVVEYQARIENVGKFLYTTMPAVDPNNFHPGLLVYENGSVNLFELPSGKIPKFTFSILELSLFVLVGDITTASWDEARSRGVSRVEWEKAQDDIIFIEENLPGIKYMQGEKRPLVFIIRWGESISDSSLHSRLSKLLKGRIE